MGRVVYISASQRQRIKDLWDSFGTGEIQTSQLADGAVTDIKVNAAAAIAYAKLNIADGAIAQAKIFGLADALAAAGSPAIVACRVWKDYAGNQLIDYPNEDAITWNQAISDPFSFHSVVTNTHLFSIPSGKDGIYRITFRVQMMGASGAGYVTPILKIFKNGTTLIKEAKLQYYTASSNVYTHCVIETEEALVAGDTIQLKIKAYGVATTVGQNSGAEFNYSNTAILQRIGASWAS